MMENVEPENVEMVLEAPTREVASVLHSLAFQASQLVDMYKARSEVLCTAILIERNIGVIEVEQVPF
ncbi:unnamed protein product [Bursaphelenchus okinawaensis]|uniref:Uncharacterized protein n=1 Tax=Bursaphelenchus okinawaensis TaxID=465554 RepID=A0A811JQQ7_9BILA|nr:unnamed protein product [Bursaphelenchus okinawaensis]CAG9078911.1 unnamed protein product [Bursaphelenchus okinawaensis]